MQALGVVVEGIVVVVIHSWVGHDRHDAPAGQCHVPARQGKATADEAGHFVAIADAIVIGIGDVALGVGGNFFVVAQAIAVGVGIGGAGAVLALKLVAQRVAIGVPIGGAQAIRLF